MIFFFSCLHSTDSQFQQVSVGVLDECVFTFLLLSNSAEEMSAEPSVARKDFSSRLSVCLSVWQTSA